VTRCESRNRLGIDVIRGLKAWQVDVVDNKSRDEYTVTLNGLDGRYKHLRQ
jgi:hypothetical protein